jgi:plasmid stability protein
MHYDAVICIRWWLHRVDMKTLTIRNVPSELNEALQRERARTGRSLNQTVIDLLNQRLGVGVARSNGLARLAGTWSDDEFDQFQKAIAPFERVDEAIWS